jgi:uncharacterized protein DUF1963
MNPTQRRVAVALAEAGIDDAEPLAALTQPSLRLRPTRSALELLPLGASRFGGVPDVPADFEWPGEDEPMPLLAQIDLAALPPSELPRAGWLLFFFYDAGNEHGVVRHVTGAREQLARAAAPEEAYPPCALEVQESVDVELPDLDDETFAAEQDKWLPFLDVVRTLRGDPPAEELDPDPIKALANHHLLGHPEAIQGPMIEELDQFDQRGATHDGPWRLLLQIESDRVAGFSWGDGGSLYFWVRAQALAEGNFERVWCISQCY